MNEKKRLGKGLDALIPAMEEENNLVREIDIKKIRANPYQPRTTFDEQKLRELAASIVEHGVIQPVIVSPESGGYVLIAGERRFRAAAQAKLEKIPAIIKETDIESKIKLALVENLQREDLNPIEEARAYQLLIDDYGFTQEKISQSISKSRPAVANTLRLLALPEEVKEAVSAGEISAGQARTLLGIKEKELLMKMFRDIVKNKSSVRDVEEKVSDIKKAKKIKRPQKTVARDFSLEDIREDLQKWLGTKVTLTQGKNKGIISIEYYGNDDLERLLEILKGEKFQE